MPTRRRSSNSSPSSRSFPKSGAARTSSWRSAPRSTSVWTTCSRCSCWWPTWRISRPTRTRRRAATSSSRRSTWAAAWWPPCLCTVARCVWATASSPARPPAASEPCATSAAIPSTRPDRPHRSRSSASTRCRTPASSSAWSTTRRPLARLPSGVQRGCGRNRSPSSAPSPWTTCTRASRPARCRISTSSSRRTCKAVSRPWKTPSSRSSTPRSRSRSSALARVRSPSRTSCWPAPRRP